MWSRGCESPGRGLVDAQRELGVVQDERHLYFALSFAKGFSARTSVLARPRVVVLLETPQDTRFIERAHREVTRSSDSRLRISNETLQFGFQLASVVPGAERKTSSDVASSASQSGRRPLESASTNSDAFCLKAAKASIMAACA